jgi:membrane protease YdiL (CAAX protease family)
MSASELNQTLDPQHTSVTATPLDDQHPIGRSIFLHLIPGVGVLAFYMAVAPLVERLGFPPTFAGSLAILFVLVPLEIGYLLYRGRRRNGRLSLAGVVRYREPVPLWQYALFVPVLIFWYFTASSLWRPVESTLAGALTWIPSWVTDLVPTGDPTIHYPAAILLTVALFQVVCSGVIAPIVEELYFRSYLLPRIERLGLWAPVIGTVLFAFQHLWTPLLNPGRVIAWLPVVYLVWRKRSIYPGIIFHLVTNLTGAIVISMSLYGAG